MVFQISDKFQSPGWSPGRTNFGLGSGCSLNAVTGRRVCKSEPFGPGNPQKVRKESSRTLFAGQKPEKSQRRAKHHRQYLGSRPPLRGVSERVSRPSGPGVQKCPKQSRKSLWSLKKDCFETPETLPRLFRTLFGPWGRKAPGDSFGVYSLGIPGPSGPGDSSKGRVGSQDNIVKTSHFFTLVATIHFSPFTCCFHRFFRR